MDGRRLDTYLGAQRGGNGRGRWGLARTEEAGWRVGAHTEAAPGAQGPPAPVPVSEERRNAWAGGRRSRAGSSAPSPRSDGRSLRPGSPRITEARPRQTSGTARPRQGGSCWAPRWPLAQPRLCPYCGGSWRRPEAATPPHPPRPPGLRLQASGARSSCPPPPSTANPHRPLTSASECRGG